MKDRSFFLVRTASFWMGKRREEVIFDFADDWHCALKLEPGMTKKDVAERMIQLAEIIFQQHHADKTLKEQKNDARKTSNF